MATKRWQDLSPETRRTIRILGTIDGVLRLIALLDLRGRPVDQVRGSKKAWGTSLAIVNSAGVLPVVYFLRGRRRG